MKKDAVSTNRLRVKRFKGKGRGVIATVDVKAHDVIEVCPVVLFKVARGENHICEEYAFRWDSKHIAIALGYGSLYNHSNKPNAYYDHNIRSKTLIVYALHDIPKGTEICFNYHGDPDDQTPVWFD